MNNYGTLLAGILVAMLIEMIAGLDRDDAAVPVALQYPSMAHGLYGKRKTSTTLGLAVNDLASFRRLDTG